MFFNKQIIEKKKKLTAALNYLKKTKIFNVKNN